MIPEEEGFRTVDGVCVYDVVLIVQIIEKLLKAGAVSGREVAHVAGLRSRLIDAASKAGVGVE